MSIDQPQVLDIMGSKEGSNILDVFITDHLPWENKRTNEHIFMLQEKINTYLAAIESGEIERRYPEHKGKSVVINVIGKYPLNDKAKWFFEKASEIVKNAGFELKFSLSP